MYDHYDGMVEYIADQALPATEAASVKPAPKSAMKKTMVKKRAEAKANIYTKRKPIAVPVAIIGVIRVIGVRVVGVRRGIRVGVWIGGRLCLYRQPGQLGLI